MSIKLMSKIWECGPNKQSEKLLLLALADHADDQGQCFPGIASLSKKCSMTERGAQKIMRRLEQDGWLSIEKNAGPHATNRYWVKVPISSLNPEHRSPPEHCSPRTAGHLPPNVETFTPEHGSPKPSLTIKESSSEKSKTSSKKKLTKREQHDQDIAEAVIPDSLKCPKFIEAWDEFTAERGDRGKYMTGRSAYQMLKKLAKYPPAVATASLTESVANGWIGVFPEKIDPQSVEAVEASEPNKQPIRHNTPEWRARPNPPEFEEARQWVLENEAIYPDEVEMVKNAEKIGTLPNTIENMILKRIQQMREGK